VDIPDQAQCMAEVHQLIITQGIEQTRRQAASKRERQVIEAAYQVMNDDADRMGFTYSGFALTSLPHKEVPGLMWRRASHNLTLLLESGRDQLGHPLGIPYGSYARFILLFLQTEAIKTSSREIELGRSMRVWMESMGLSIGGATYRKVSDQARRISGCRLTFFGEDGEKDIRSNGGFVKTAITLSSLDDDGRATVWSDRVLLDEDFYRALREHPVPISETALRAIGPRSLVIDVYIWLAYRLHAVRDSVDVGWAALQRQFGIGFSRPRQFRMYFLECLDLAMAAYPDARVSLSDRGVVLHRSRPPVLKIECGF
jgi:hypothetical protein